MILSIIGFMVATVLIIIYVIITFILRIDLGGIFLNPLALAIFYTPVLPTIGLIFSIIGIAKNDNQAPGIIGLVFALVGIIIAIASILIEFILHLILPLILPSIFP